MGTDRPWGPSVDSEVQSVLVVCQIIAQQIRAGQLPRNISDVQVAQMLRDGLKRVGWRRTA